LGSGERQPATVLGLVYDREEAELRRLDALTLLPVGRSRLGGLTAGMFEACTATYKKALVGVAGNGNSSRASPVHHEEACSRRSATSRIDREPHA